MVMAASGELVAGKWAFPRYRADNRCVPAASGGGLIVAAPLTIAAPPTTVLPSMNCTVPVGVPPPSGRTAAMSVAGWPAACGFVCAIRNGRVEAASGRTVADPALERLAAKFVLPPYA